MKPAYVKTKVPLKVGSLVRHSGCASNFRRVTAINGDQVTVESYGNFTHETGMVLAKRKVFRTYQLGTDSWQEFDGRWHFANANLCAAGPHSGYRLDHVVPA